MCVDLIPAWVPRSRCLDARLWVRQYFGVRSIVKGNKKGRFMPTEGAVAIFSGSSYAKTVEGSIIRRGTSG